MILHKLVYNYYATAIVYTPAITVLLDHDLFDHNIAIPFT